MLCASACQISSIEIFFAAPFTITRSQFITAYYQKETMKSLTSQEAAEFLASATITETSEESGIVIAQRGVSADGTPFVLINGRDDGMAMLFTSD